MISKTWRLVLAIVWGVLALPAGYFALALYGLARLDSGVPTFSLGLVVMLAFPVILAISCIGEIIALSSSDSKHVMFLARTCAILPLVNILFVIVLALLQLP